MVKKGYPSFSKQIEDYAQKKAKEETKEAMLAAEAWQSFKDNFKLEYANPLDYREVRDREIEKLNQLLEKQRNEYIH